MFDNDLFTNRKFKIGYCPVCDKALGRLIETRKTDGKVFDTLYTKAAAKKAIKDFRTEVNYSSLDIKAPKGLPYGWKYGENKEIVNKKTNERTIIQRSCDFYGNKQEIARKKQSHT